MKQLLEVGTARAAAGERARGVLKVAELNDGSPIEIPVVCVNGVGDGPVVWIQNGVHGDEYVGLGAIHRLMKDLDPSRMNGGVVVMPIVNIQAYRAGQRGATQDGMDMNRVYPGKPLKTAMHLFAHTEVVVHKVFEEIKQKADAVLDIHDGGWMGTMSSYIQYFAFGTDVDKKARALSMASGMDIVWESPAPFVAEKAPGSVGTAAGPLNIPTVTVEIGGEGRMPPEHLERMYLALANMLKHMGVLSGQLVDHVQGERIYVKQGHWLRPERGGAWYPQVQAAQRVKKGDLVGIVTDLFGEEVERLHAPADGIVIGLRTYGMIATGQYALNVSEVVDSLE